jgi:hypothetical protein
LAAVGLDDRLSLLSYLAARAQPNQDYESIELGVATERISELA